ncbi:MAG: hypothetical protein ACOZBH_05670 [Patescibacteria group bacterium]
MSKALRIVSATIRVGDVVKDFNGVAIPYDEVIAGDGRWYSMFRVSSVNLEAMSVSVDEASVGVASAEVTPPPITREKMLPMAVVRRLEALGFTPDRIARNTIALCHRDVKPGTHVRIISTGQKADEVDRDAAGDHRVTAIVQKSERGYGFWITIEPVHYYQAKEVIDVERFSVNGQVNFEFDDE